MSDKEIGEQLDRSAESVTKKRFREGLKKNKSWDDEDYEFIRDNWREKSDAELAEALGVSINAVRNKRIKELDIARPESHSSKFNNGIHWSEDKENFLEDNYFDMTVKELSNHFNCSEQAIYDKASELNLKKLHHYTKHELEFIERVYHDGSSWSINEVGDYLNLSFSQIANAVSKYNLSFNMQKPFSDDEIEFLSNNYVDMTQMEMADKLDRHQSVVARKLSSLGLFQTPVWSESEKSFLKDNWNDLSDYELSEELGRGVVGVKEKRRELGLKYDTVIDTDSHFEWEEICVKIAEELYNNVAVQKRFESGLRPDIFIKSKGLVIDAKLSVYQGCLEDVQKYLSNPGVDKVVVWSYRAAYELDGVVQVFDRNDLKKKIGDELVGLLESFDPDFKEKDVKQVSLTARRSP